MPQCQDATSKEAARCCLTRHEICAPQQLAVCVWLCTPCQRRLLDGGAPARRVTARLMSQLLAVTVSLGFGSVPLWASMRGTTVADLGPLEQVLVR